MTKQICLIFVLLIILFLLIFSLNFYFLNRLNNDQLNGKDPQQNDKPTYVQNLIRRSVNSLKPVYLNKNPRFYTIRNKLLKHLSPAHYDNVTVVWDIVHWWPDDNEIYPPNDGTMGQLIQALKAEQIVSAKNSPKGTQLKLLLTLVGNQKVIFKPKWYERNAIIDGPVYSGKDRFNAEIFGFYLGSLLNMRWTPVAVGRKLNMKEIYDKADRPLRRTMTVDVLPNENRTDICVFGKCFYCKESEPVCGDENGLLEGAILQVIPGTLAKYRSPWQRTYKDNQKAEWEDNMNYCGSVKEKYTQTRILDLVDASIFDFILQNGDRHHYETRNERIVLIDNGKGLGNSNYDFLDILAPLYQCCILRRSTWERLLVFSGGTLTELIDQISRMDDSYPLLTPAHYRAVNRRFLLIFSAVEFCFQKFGNAAVLK